MRVHYFLVFFLALESVIADQHSYVVKFSCSGVVTTTSQCNLHQLWSTARSRAATQLSSGYAGTILSNLGSTVQQLVELDSNQLFFLSTLFEIGNFNSVSANSCTVELNPRRPVGTIVGPARLLLYARDSESCPTPVTVLMTLSNINYSVQVKKESESKMFDTYAFVQLEESSPIYLQFGNPCTLRFLWIVDQQDSFRLYHWLPIIVLSTLVVFDITIYLVTMRLREKELLRSTAYFLCLLGFAFSCTEFIITISHWKNVTGIHLPYPSPIFFFFVFTIFFGALFLGLCAWWSNAALMGTGAMRILVLISIVSCTIGFFCSGFVLLGLLSLLQLFIGNTLLALHYSHVISNNYKIRAINPLVLSNSSIWGYIWCPPLALFAPTFLLHFTLYTSSRRKKMSSQELLFIRLHFLQSSVLLFVVHNIVELSLIVAASFVHLPFILFLWFLVPMNVSHLIYLLQNIRIATTTFSGWRSFLCFLLFCSNLTFITSRHFHEVNENLRSWVRCSEVDRMQSCNADEPHSDSPATVPMVNQKCWPSSIERADHNLLD